MSIRDNPDPLRYKYACSEHRDWIDHPASGCGDFVPASVFDVNHCLIVPYPTARRIGIGILLGAGAGAVILAKILQALS